MLGKILITALVIIGCLFFLRYRQTGAVLESDGPARGQRRIWGALALAVVVLVIGGFIFHLNSSDKQPRRLMDVRVVNAVTGESAHYQAFDDAIQGRSFTTVEGIQIRIADSERLEFVLSQ